jgi:putative PEP-CTERM system TPR-repeat lipoprotein
MKRSLFTLFIFVAIFSVKSFASSSEDYEKANMSFISEDYDTAYIHLKNSLQKSPDNLPAKILMGQLLLRNGYVEDAEAVLLEALDEGADINLVIEHIGTAFLFQRKYNEINELKIKDKLEPKAHYKWLLIEATAHFSLKNIEQARSKYSQAIRLTDDNIQAINGLTILELSDGELSAADMNVDKALVKDNDNSDSWHIKGKIALARNNLNQAQKFLEKAYELANKSPLIMRSLVDVYIQSKNVSRAQVFLDKILIQTPNDPMAMLLNSWLLTQKDELAAASAELGRLSSLLSSLDRNKAFDEPHLLFIAGVSSYAQQNFEQAQKVLTQYLEIVPENLNAITLLSKAHSKLGKKKLAMNLLDRHRKKLTHDLETALFLCDLYIENNSTFKAISYLDSIQTSFPNNKKVSLMEAKILVARNKSDEAIALLNNIPEAEQDANIQLIKSMISLKKGDYQGANKIAYSLLKNSPKNTDFMNLKAAIALKLKNWEQAQNMLDKALTIDPSHFAATVNLAKLHYAKKDFLAAKELLKKLIENVPNHVQSQLLLGRTQKELKDYPAAIVTLLKVKELDPNNVTASELLAILYTQSGNLKNALNQLNKLPLKIQAHPNFLIRYSDIYIREGNFDKAQRSINSLNLLVQNDPRLLLELSKLYKRTNNIDEARNTLVKARVLLPQNLKLSLELAKLYIETNDLEQAAIVLNSIDDNHKKKADVLLLTGDLAKSNKQLSKASALYLAAYKTDRNFTFSLMKLYQLAIEGIGVEEFIREIGEMTMIDPTNEFRRNLLADLLFSLGKKLEAKPHYEWLIKNENYPNNPSIHNNLAIIYLNTDILKAEEHINKAVTLNQNSAAILDTQGWIIAQLGRFEEALTILREAFARDSNNPAIRYHLAYALHKLGRNNEAKKELSISTSSKYSFPEKQDALKLLVSI